MKRTQSLRRFGITGRGLVVTLPYVWLLLFFVVPFVIVLKISFSDIDLAIPPYKPLIEWTAKNALAIKINFNNYAFSRRAARILKHRRDETIIAGRKITRHVSSPLRGLILAHFPLPAFILRDASLRDAPPE